LVNRKLDKDYGDVDVFAWSSDGKKVFAIECKNLKLAKTPNEVAEQLNNFTGKELKNGDRDDLLKHLDRCSILKEYHDRVAKTIGVENSDINIQAVVCFSNPVPMLYVADRLPGVEFLPFEDLSQLI